MLTATTLRKLLDLAGDTATLAGRYIAAFDRSCIKVDSKAAGSSLASQVVTQVDLACEAIIQEQLAPACEQFDIAFLGEESASNCPVEQHPRLSQPYFWSIDPLDGTLPFTENKPGYAVSIALVAQDGKPILGAVYDPVSKTLYQALVPQPASGMPAVLLKQGKPWQPGCAAENAQTLTLFLDRSFTQLSVFSSIVELLQQQAKRLGYQRLLVDDGAGAVLNAVQVLAQAPACYFKFPKQNEGGGCLWDFAASAALFNASGTWVSDIYGAPLQLNAPDSLFMNRKGVLYASDKKIAELVMRLFSDYPAAINTIQKST